MDSRKAQRRAKKGPTEEAVRDEAAIEQELVDGVAADVSHAEPSERGDAAQAVAEEAAAVVEPDAVIDPEEAVDGQVESEPEDEVVDGEVESEPEDEVVDGEVESEPEDEVVGGEVESEPEDPIARAERERDEYLAVAQRTQADFENYRKRAAKEAAATGERARSGLVRELLPVVDNLERALASASAEEDHLADGVRLVRSELLAVLERNGVNAFDPAGEPFDPNLHDALSTRSEEGADPGVVLDVVEPGYRLGDAVLRPARVVVSG